MTCKRAYGTEITESSNNEIRLVYREEFGDRGKCHCFDKRKCHSFFEKSDDNTDFAVFEEQDRGGKHLTPSADPNIDNLPESVYDGHD